MIITQTLRRAFLLSAMVLTLTACETRSISDSGYRADNGRASNPFYRGELSAHDILGIDPERQISEEDIRKALATKQRLSVRKGSAVMLVQSGTPFPDHDMVAAMERYYTVAVFSGVPLPNARSAAANSEAASYAQIFRLAAAKGGYETIMVYWGMLESATEGSGGKALSWLPIIGGSIPDQSQLMRIRLMVAVIDVASGQWETFTPEPFVDSSSSAERRRAISDQEQVAMLKGKAYKAAADTLVQRYSR
ncbi:MAG: hypothetical protein ACK4FJ_03860 [Ferrovibrio sp.]|uniref:hypothetical protein n=1 Tax=Ferrovibrio sp. TaxID=1917215 RepID=UPI00391B9B40